MSKSCRRSEFHNIKELIHSGTTPVNLQYILSQSRTLTPYQKQLILHYHDIRTAALASRLEKARPVRLKMDFDDHLIRGFVAHELHQNSQAMQHYCLAMQQEHHRSSIMLFNIGLLAEARSVAEAIKHYEQSLREQPVLEEVKSRIRFIRSFASELTNADECVYGTYIVRERDMATGRVDKKWIKNYNKALGLYRSGLAAKAEQLFAQLQQVGVKELSFRCLIMIARINEDNKNFTIALSTYRTAQRLKSLASLTAKIESLQKSVNGAPSILRQSNLLGHQIISINSERVYRCLSNFRRQLKTRSRLPTQCFDDQKQPETARPAEKENAISETMQSTVKAVTPKSCLKNRPLHWHALTPSPRSSKFRTFQQNRKSKGPEKRARINVAPLERPGSPPQNEQSNKVEADPKIDPKGEEQKKVQQPEQEHEKIPQIIEVQECPQVKDICQGTEANKKLKPYRQPEIKFDSLLEQTGTFLPRRPVKKTSIEEKSIESCRSLDYILDFNDPEQWKNLAGADGTAPRESSSRLKPMSSLLQRGSISKALTIHIADAQGTGQRALPLNKLDRDVSELEKGMEFFRNYMFKEAVICMKAVLNNEEEAQQSKLSATRYLAVIYDMLDMPDKAVVYLKKDIAHTPDVKLFMRIEQIYRKIGKVHKAIPILKKGLDRFPKQPLLFEYLGWIYLERNELVTALDYLEKARSLDSESMTIKLKLFHTYLLKQTTIGNCRQLLSELFSCGFQRAISEYEKLLLANFLESSGNYSQVLKVLNSIYEDNHQNENYLYMMGRLHSLHSKYQEAYRFLKAALAINPGKIHAIIDLAQIYRKLENYPRAIELFTKCTELQPQNIVGWKGLADSYFDIENYSTALKYFKKCRDIETNNQGVFILLARMGDCMQKLGYSDLALKYYKKSLSLHVVQPTTFTKIGNIYKKQGRFNKALEHYNAADQFNEFIDMENEISKIQCLIGDKQYKQCLVVLNNLRKNSRNLMQPNLELQLHLAAAFCYYGLNQFQKAIQYYRKALRFNKADEICFDIAVCYHKLQQLNDAVFNYLQSIKLNPKNPRSFFNMGSLYRQKGDLHLACEYMQQALLLRPEEEWATILADIYIDMGDYARSEIVLQNLLTIKQSSTREKNFYQMVKVQVRQSRIQRASEIFERLREQFPESSQLTDIKKAIVMEA